MQNDTITTNEIQGDLSQISFLRRVATHLVDKYSDTMADVCVVVPNNRAKVHLKKHLRESFVSSAIFPEMMSIDEFLVEMMASEKSVCIIDQVSLLLEFYKLNSDSAFSNYMSWAPVALKDFNEIDLYEADAQEVYTYISEAKLIEEWDMEGKGLTDFEKNYVQFFRSLGDRYKNLREALWNKGLAYTGQLYREVAEHISALTPKMRWSKVIFAGFNALSTCEIDIFDFLQKQNVADILWDVDNYYLHNIQQEAGMFFRRHEKRWKNVNEQAVSCFKNDKNITIIGASGNIQQAKIAADILQKNDFRADETAIVLADESMLLPVLNSIPDKYDTFNVTMGVPLNGNPIAELVSDLMSMHINAIANDNSTEIYYRGNDYEKVVSNPLIRNLLFAKDKLEAELLGKLSFDRIIVTSFSDLTKDYPAFSPLFSPWNGNSTVAIKALLEITSLLKQTADDLNFEVLVSLSQVLSQIFVHVEEYKVLDDVYNLSLMFHFYISNLSVSFKGEPLSGLQILGVLETRLLDFKNVILLSANEDILPKNVPFNTFMTSELIHHLNMPMAREKTAVFAYHFYRLIQRAENIFLIYNDSENALSSNEKSRYITQLQLEMPDYNPHINITVANYFDKIPQISALENETIEKTPEIIDLFRKKLETKISATEVVRYQTCRLCFYYIYILGIKDRPEIMPVDPVLFGNIVHFALSVLYGRNLGVPLTEKIIDTYIDDISLTVETAFREYNLPCDAGRNLLLKKMAEYYVRAMLLIDKKKVTDSSTMTILKVEQLLRCTLPVKLTDGTTIKVVLSGIIDRIELFNGRLRIMDYKTGAFSDYERGYSFDMDSIILEGIDEKLMQILFYAVLVNANRDKLNLNFEELYVGIYPLRYAGSRKELMLDVPVNAKLLSDYTEYLKDIFRDMLESTEPLKHTEDAKKGRRCIIRG